MRAHRHRLLDQEAFRTAEEILRLRAENERLRAENLTLQEEAAAKKAKKC